MTASSPDGVRIIKRYANRKLYDTGSGELTSLGRIEELVRAGVDIRVVDHDSGADMTGELLAGILGNSFGERPAENDIPLLTLLIRTPGDLLQALLRDEERSEELRAMGDRVRLLSATIDALLAGMEAESEQAVPESTATTSENTTEAKASAESSRHATSTVGNPRKRSTRAKAQSGSDRRKQQGA